MIHPNMATMLVFLTTDAAISTPMLQKALSGDIQNTFNMVSVDGDTSTNDMVTILANGLAENPEITEENEDFAAFMKALNTVNVYLCRCLAGDGEGATKLLECKVTGAADDAAAKTIAKSVICSSLTKAAMFGADANWGRVLCAIGYSGAPVDVNKVAVSFRSPAGTVAVCENGAGIPFSEEIAKQFCWKRKLKFWSAWETATPPPPPGLRPDLRLCENQRRLSDMMNDCTFSNAQRAQVLTQALPYIRQYNGKVVVIKYGGNAMINEERKQQVMEDIVLLWLVGVKVVLVHGGGPEISDLMEKLGKKPEFVDGLRVTDQETVDIAQMVLAGKVNKTLVGMLERRGGNAMGISGLDGALIRAEQKDPRLGYVGKSLP